MDYTSLGATVSVRLNRTDITSLYDGFIAQVESEANSFLSRNPVRPMVKSYTLASGEQRLELPADFIDVLELRATDGTDTWPLARLKAGESSDYYANRSLAPGIAYDPDKPQQYRILGNTLVLSVDPADSLTFTLDCYAKLEPLSESNATNWLMDSHSDVYEFGTLAHAGKHLRDYDFYDKNRDLFLGALEQVAQSYPEKARDVALVDTGAPWASGYRSNIYA